MRGRWMNGCCLCCRLLPPKLVSSKMKSCILLVIFILCLCSVWAGVPLDGANVCADLSASQCVQYSFSGSLLPSFTREGAMVVSSSSVLSLAGADASPFESTGVCDTSQGAVIIDATEQVKSRTRDIHLRMRVTGGTSGSIGFVWYYVDSSNFMRFSMTDECTSVQRMWNGDLVEVSKTGGIVANGYTTSAWYRVSLSQSSDQFVEITIADESNSLGTAKMSFFVLGNLPLEEKFYSMGQIGFQCSDSLRCEFDDVVIVDHASAFKLKWPQDCFECGGLWTQGSVNWCRCCANGCGSYSQQSCLDKGACSNGVCTSGLSAFCPFKPVESRTNNTCTDCDDLEAGGGMAAILAAVVAAMIVLVALVMVFTIMVRMRSTGTEARLARAAYDFRAESESNSSPYYPYYYDEESDDGEPASAKPMKLKKRDSGTSDTSTPTKPRSRQTSMSASMLGSSANTPGNPLRPNRPQKGLKGLQASLTSSTSGRRRQQSATELSSMASRSRRTSFQTSATASSRRAGARAAAVQPKRRARLAQRPEL